MYIKILNDTDKAQFDKLLEITFNNLSDKAFYLPIEEYEADKLNNRDECIIFGLFNRLSLIGTIVMFLNEDNPKGLENLGKSIVLGRLMILPEYRNKHYAKHLIKHSINYAENTYSNDYNNILITVHPDNIASYHSFENVGFQKITSATYEYDNIEYDRDILIKSIKKGK